jgi:hypothetical protein
MRNGIPLGCEIKVIVHEPFDSLDSDCFLIVGEEVENIMHIVSLSEQLVIHRYAYKFLNNIIILLPK